MFDLQTYAELAENASAQELFIALEAMVHAEIGAIIFSCSTFDLATGQSRRIHTNQPEIYPVSGLKAITPNAWTKVVLDSRNTFVANSLAEISEVFPDHAIIHSLGCGSVINMPVFLSGRFLGTVNILNKPNYYGPNRVKKLHDMRAAAMLAFSSFLLEMEP
jgi:hypothetical protein